MIETKKYSDGTSAIGQAPLPSRSPRQQDVAVALLHLDDIEAMLGGRNGPSIRLRAMIERIANSS